MTLPAKISKLFFFPVILLSFYLPVHAVQWNYILDKNSSTVRVLAYKQGALHWFGHNHVISHIRIDGELRSNAADLTNNEFTLVLPVADFIVDDVQHRLQSGEAFSSLVNSEDAQATRENMLGHDLLDAASFNKIIITGKLESISSSQAIAHLKIKIKEVSQDLVVPVHLQISATKLISRGRFSVKQSDFGLQPFSLLGGMLAVQDQIDIVFVFVAYRSE